MSWSGSVVAGGTSGTGVVLRISVLPVGVELGSSTSLVVGVATVVGSLLADITYAVLDPRVHNASGRDGSS